MAETTCPFCDAILGAKEMGEGWCDSCGKKLPSALVTSAAQQAATAVPSTAPAQETSPSGLHKFARLLERITLGALLAVILGGGVALALYNLLPDNLSPSEAVRNSIAIGWKVLTPVLFVCVLAAKGFKVLTGP